MLKSFLLATALLTLSAVEAQELVNGDFREWNLAGFCPFAWENSSPGASFIESGKEGGACITIIAFQRFHPALVQHLDVRGKGGWMRLSGEIRATIPEMAYLEVKLFEKDGEVRRFSSRRNSKDPTVAVVNFNTANAVRIDLMCRVVAELKHVGKNAVFSRLVLEPGADPDRTVPFTVGRLNPEKFTNSSETTGIKVSAKAVEVQVEAPARYDSAFQLKLGEIPPARNFHFAADVSSNRGMNGYISAKLFRKGREIARRESVKALTGKRTLFIDFNTGNADCILLLCRVRQNLDDVGTRVRFEKLVLGEGEYKKGSGPPPPRFSCIPGYEDCSVYVNHCKAKDSSVFSGRVHYREIGSTQWLEAPPLVYVPDEKGARSSLFRLKEKTGYELRIALRDNGEEDCIESGFRTRCSQVPIGKTILLGPENFGGRLVPEESGSAEGYVRYVAKPGFVLEGFAGGEDVIHLANLHHILLDGLVVRGGRRFGITISGSENIIIRDCDIARFGQTGIPDMSIGYKYCAGGEALRDIAGIRIVESGKLLIERNFIHDTLGKTCPWFYSHPDGPFGILLYSTGGVTLRYNDIIGSDSFRWNDVVGGYYNGSEFGSFYRDASIYGNFLAFANDDGIELDGGQMNCRFYRNRVEGTLCGVSTAPCLLGPVYIFENLFCNPGDEFQVANVALKNNFGSFGKGRLHYFNNTVYGGWSGYSGYYSIPVRLDFPAELKALSRNNIFAVSGYYYDPGAFVLPNDFDFNLFWKSAGSSMEDIAPALRQARSKGYESHSLTEDPKFRNAGLGDFRLSPDSSAVASGSPVSGLFVGKPDMGALQTGGCEQLPCRPSALVVRVSRVNFNWPGRIGEQTLRLETSGDGVVKFTVKQPENNDFFSVKPSEGLVAPNRPVELRISLHSERMPDAKVYSGAFLICDPDGYSRPISVWADFRGDVKKVAKRRGVVLYGKVSPQDEEGRCFAEFEIPREGDYFLFGFLSRIPGYVLMRRTDGGEGHFRRTRFYGIPGSASPTWQGMNSDLYTTKACIPRHYKKGRCRFEIMPYRGEAYRIEKVALAAMPEELLYSPFSK